jgi:hypothetical protein
MPIINGKANSQIQLNGIYVSLNSRGSMIFYSDGSCKNNAADPEGDVFWDNPDSVFKCYYEDWDFLLKEVWGHYSIHKDSIKIQSFGHANDQLCKRSVYETVGEILNDSTLVIYSDYSYWFKSELLEEPNIYGFYPTTIKPDSTKAWFNNRRWFNKYLHESRK